MESVSQYYKSYDQTIVSYTDYIYHHSLKIDKMWDKFIVDAIIENLEPNTDILDIGANIGLVTLGLIKSASDKGVQLGNIHCFECDMQTCMLLFKNIVQHTNVKLYPFALTDKHTLCNTNVNAHNMGCNFIYHTTNAENDIEYTYKHAINDNFKQINNVFTMGVPLDSLKYQFKNRISVIKIDVEGFELFVLKGAKDIINRDRPIIIVEVFECNFDKVIEFFKEVDYAICKRVENPDYYGQDWIFFPNM